MDAYEVAGWACIALGLLVWFVVAIVTAFDTWRGLTKAQRTALAHLLDGPPCAVLTCHDVATEWVYDRLLCEGHAERILNRAPFDQAADFDAARDALDDVLDGRAK